MSSRIWVKRRLNENKLSISRYVEHTITDGSSLVDIIDEAYAQLKEESESAKLPLDTVVYYHNKVVEMDLLLKDCPTTAGDPFILQWSVGELSIHSPTHPFTHHVIMTLQKDKSIAFFFMWMCKEWKTEVPRLLSKCKLSVCIIASIVFSHLLGKVMSDGSTFAMTLSNVVYHSTTLMTSYLYVHTSILRSLLLTTDKL